MVVAMACYNRGGRGGLGVSLCYYLGVGCVDRLGFHWPCKLLESGDTAPFCFLSRVACYFGAVSVSPTRSRFTSLTRLQMYRSPLFIAVLSSPCRPSGLPTLCSTSRVSFFLSCFSRRPQQEESAAAAAGGQNQESGGEPNSEDVNLEEGDSAAGIGGAEDGNGDIRIVQKEVPSAVFGSAKEALAKEQAAAAAGGGGKGKGGGMGALQRLKAAGGGGGGGLGSK